MDPFLVVFGLFMWFACTGPFTKHVKHHFTEMKWIDLQSWQWNCCISVTLTSHWHVWFDVAAGPYTILTESVEIILTSWFWFFFIFLYVTYMAVITDESDMFCVSRPPVSGQPWLPAASLGWTHPVTGRWRISALSSGSFYTSLQAKCFVSDAYQLCESPRALLTLCTLQY